METVYAIIFDQVQERFKIKREDELDRSEHSVAKIRNFAQGLALITNMNREREIA